MVFDRICYLRRDLRLKLCLHYLETLMTFTFLYYYYVIEHSRAWQTDMFVWWKSIRLMIGAAQILHGYPMSSSESFLRQYTQPITLHDHLLKDTMWMCTHYVYLLYRTIPFAFEMKALLDWSFTRTTLHLRMWFKLEDIYHELLLTRGYRGVIRSYHIPPGSDFPFYIKAYTGVLMFSGMLFLFFFPLLYYSTFSPALVLNRVTHTRVTIMFSSTTSLYEGMDVGIVNAYDTIRTTHPHILDRLAPNPNEHHNQLITLTSYSLSMWLMSFPSLQAMTRKLLNKESIHLVMKAQFTQNMGDTPLVQTVTQAWAVPLDPQVRAHMVGVLQNGSGHLALPNFYAPFIENGPITVSADDRSPKCDCALTLSISSQIPDSNGLGGLLQSFSIIAIYTTFVLTAGRLVQNVLTGTASRVVLEDMQDPIPLLMLIEDIRMARSEGDLKLEDELFLELITIYQSPESIRQWTGLNGTESE
eukprot:NODE_1043_length_1690_cov_5.660909_g980_i0.p1 GENE.NODE_1043_length_1690_cov_5.660909_g980_i0~~NODE_1043_length_1690_cov_5.660909_g980_i0.p1  ORF type:complete len:472 (+),score=131.12 NODE_1043_length_1690_cov_5.660909_g980_i0:226-1641(+)